MSNKIKIAALSCSYNRLKKTSTFLDSLKSQEIPDEYVLDIYVLDDNSTDGTADHISSKFPDVHLVKGSGSLFWAGGMRTLWETARKAGEYDYFLLLNDDVVLLDGAVARLLSAHELSGLQASIILGAVLDPKTQILTYGGHKLINKVTGRYRIQQPDQTKLIACEIGNANIMLVDKFSVKKIGILSDVFVHGYADYDYTLLAIKNDVHVFLAPGYFGYCENDHELTWVSQKLPLAKRIDYLYSPKGIGYNEYIKFIKRNFPLMLPITYIRVWTKTLFPFIYERLGKK